MRSIKFRALELDSPIGINWGYGYYAEEIGTDYNDKPCIRYYIIDGYGTKYEIASDTLCQFTGLKDRRGLDIYEGDIVKWDDQSNGKYWRVAVVKIDPDLYFHCFDCPKIPNSSSHGHKFHYGNFIYTDTENHLEIIGNIYENSELLEEL